MRCFNDSYGQCLLQMLRTVRVLFDPLADVSFMFRMLRNVAFPLQNHKCSTLCRLLSCSISANGQHHRIAAGAMLQCSGWLWPLAPKAICRNSLHQYILFSTLFTTHQLKIFEMNSKTTEDWSWLYWSKTWAVRTSQSFCMMVTYLAINTWFSPGRIWILHPILWRRQQR